MNHNMICFLCPQSCELLVEDREGEIAVEGNRCPRGRSFAEKEMRDPERVLTSTVKVEGGEWPLVSVRSLAGVRKDELRTLIALLDGITLSAPVRLGDIVLKGAGRNKVDIIATRSVAMRRNITL